VTSAQGVGSDPPSGTGGTSRDFTVAVFVVDQSRVLLLFHRRLRKWLPPGGHIEPNELPDDAAVREVREETGVAVRLWGPAGAGALGEPRPLTRPAGIQLEPIAPGHEHIDLVYFAVPVDPGSQPVANDEVEGVRWSSMSEVERLGAPPDVVRWARLALATVAAGSRDC
jgi:8-oxo-dGTP pyrophosphatase MutT (NUDIX family)